MIGSHRVTFVLQKGWIIRSVTVGNKSGQKLQAEAMKREMVSECVCYSPRPYHEVDS